MEILLKNTTKKMCIYSKIDFLKLNIIFIYNQFKHSNQHIITLLLNSDIL